MTGGSRPLDFIVIGAQKAGTTSLWQYLRHHPSISMPLLKEAPLFSQAAIDAGEYDAFFAAHLGNAANGALLGKATPAYMMGNRGVDVGEVARRIADRLPRVKLIALLRDPIERALSHHRMSVRRGLDDRPFDLAAEELLEPEALRAGREDPSEVNSYLAQGEYGRILCAYRECFPADRVHVEQFAALRGDPDGVIDRVLEFLGLPAGYRPDNLGVRYHVGGSTRIPPEREAWLFEFMDENVWPHLRDGRGGVKAAFEFFYEIWSVLPDSDPPLVSPAVRVRLEEHFRADAERLATLGIGFPWIGEWDGGATSADVATVLPRSPG